MYISLWVSYKAHKKLEKVNVTSRIWVSVVLQQYWVIVKIVLAGSVRL